MNAVTLFHGGKAGLNPGEMLVPSDPHVTDGCLICVARAEGRSVTVAEYRVWAAATRNTRVLQMLDGADPREVIDPPSQVRAVYVTTDPLYATFYAARSQGDFYRVEPVGAMTASTEDHFAPTWTVGSARVVAVVRRRVVLSRRERREIMRRWAKADRRGAA